MHARTQMHASHACTTCVHHMHASHACITCVRHMRASHACVTCVRHMRASHACRRALHELRAVCRPLHLSDRGPNSRGHARPRRRQRPAERDARLQRTPPRAGGVALPVWHGGDRRLSHGLLYGPYAQHACSYPCVCACLHTCMHARHAGGCRLSYGQRRSTLRCARALPALDPHTSASSVGPSPALSPSPALPPSPALSRSPALSLCSPRGPAGPELPPQAVPERCRRLQLWAYPNLTPTLTLTLTLTLPKPPQAVPERSRLLALWADALDIANASVVELPHWQVCEPCEPFTLPLTHTQYPTRARA